jgi:hypothetical protein
MVAIICISVRPLLYNFSSRLTISAGEFQKAYPEAKLIAVQAAIDKKGGEGLRFDGGKSI